jgi:hypothetical protein
VFNVEGTLTLNGGSSINDNHARSSSGGIFNFAGTLNGVVAGSGGNVFDNTPEDVVSV